MTIARSLRPAREVGRRPPGGGPFSTRARAALRETLWRSPVAALVATGALGAIIGLDVAWSRPVALGASMLLTALGGAALAAALAVQDYRPLLAGIVVVGAGAAAADLPIHRAGASVEAAVAGGLLVVLAEALHWATTARPGSLGGTRPALRRCVWVAVVATSGSALGWALDTLQGDLGGLGLGALALGALGAVGLVGVVTALARADVTR